MKVVSRIGSAAVLASAAAATVATIGIAPTVAHAAVTTVTLSGPVGSGQFGSLTDVLSNGNLVVVDFGYDSASQQDVGAVYLYDGIDNHLISALTGVSNGDGVGSGGIVEVGASNFVVSSPGWDNGGTMNAGAVTWVDGDSGLNGVVTAGNSLVGTTANDMFLNAIVVLKGAGNYVVASQFWDNGATVDAGAVTWGSGSSGVAGTVSPANSLIGTTADDRVGTTVTRLENGSYVVGSPEWDRSVGATNAGASTWGSGASGVSGAVSITNSLVGAITGDRVGELVTALTNGNYVIASPQWNDAGAIVNAGAATWGNGSTGITGDVSVSNSLIGASANDRVGSSACAR